MLATARRSCNSGVEVLFVPAVLADGDFAIAESVRQPLGDHAAKPLVVADVGFVGAAEIHMGQFMRNDAKQVGFDGVRVEVDRALFVADRAFAKFLIWRALDFYGPPFAVKPEAKRRTFGALLHLSL